MAEPLRLRRLQQARNRLNQMRARREGAIAMLIRSEKAIMGLERQVRRLEKALAAPPTKKVKQPEVSDVTEVTELTPYLPDVEPIPEFLKRDQAAAQAIREEQTELKKAKAAGRAAKMKAKQAGDLNKMPLTGKAALAAIRGN